VQSVWVPRERGPLATHFEYSNVMRVQNFKECRLRRVVLGGKGLWFRLQSETDFDMVF